MGIFDRLLGRNTKNTAVATADQLLPLQTTMRRQGWITGIGGQDLYATLSRRLPGSLKDWTGVAGDLMLNSIVSIAIDYYIRAFTSAVPMVYRPDGTGEYVEVKDHPLLKLLANPQYQLAPTRFWSNLIIDYKIYGNCYFRKIRKGNNGPVIGLQYLPSQSMKPIGDGTNALVKWQYVVDGIPYDCKLEDIVQIAYGRDPLDYRIGRSPLMSCLREICVDNTASSAAFGLMSNSGLPSIIVAPDTKDDVVDVSDDDLRTLKKRLEDSFTQDNAGSIAILSGPFKMEKVSFSPSDMALDVIRHTPEERISSALGLNCMVLNLSAGLENSTYSNLQEAENAAWNQGVIPMLNVIAEAITQALLPEFPEANQEGDYFDFDINKVLALQENMDSVTKRSVDLYTAGIIDRAEAKRMLGYEPTPDDEQLYSVNYQPQYFETENPNHPPTEPNTNIGKSIKFLPTQEMKTEAEKGLAWREEFNRGGTDVGINRAKQILSGEKLSERDILDMYSFFARHEVDKKAEGFKPGEKGYPSNGRIAWALWGGDAGYRFATTERNKMMD